MPAILTETDEKSFSPVSTFETLTEARENVLVVLSMGLDCLIRVEEGGYALWADPAFEVAIKEEFRLYAAEQSVVKPPPVLPVFSGGLEWAILWVASIFYGYILQGDDSAFTGNFCNSSVAVVSGGEFWRPFTSLFLHGDLNHLMGNVAFGLLFCVFVAHSIGPKLGWVLVFLSGTIGNLINAYLHYPESFLSLGASTATFGALGILVGVGVEVAWRSHSYHKLNRAVLPLFAGLIIFGWTGVGGPEVDVAGHVLGFGVGVLLGIPASRMRSAEPAAV